MKYSVPSSGLGGEKALAAPADRRRVHGIAALSEFENTSPRFLPPGRRQSKKRAGSLLQRKGTAAALMRLGPLAHVAVLLVDHVLDDLVQQDDVLFLQLLMVEPKILVLAKR